MNQLDFLTWQLRGVILLTLGYPLLACGFTFLKIESSRVRWWTVLTVLVIAVCPWTMNCEIAWYPATHPAAIATTPSPEFDLTTHSIESWEPWGNHEPTEFMQSFSTAANPPTAKTDWFTHWPFATETIGKSILQPTWLLLTMLLLFAGCWRYFRVVAAARQAVPADDVWLREWRTLLRERGVSRDLPLLATTAIGPMLGLLPRGFALLVPAEFWRSIEPRQRGTILRHELAHFLRGDIVATFVLRLVAVPFAYHPFTQRLISLFEEAAEWDCDRAACGKGERVYYAQALEKLLASNVPAISLALGRCAQSHPLVLRVRRILNPSSPKESLMKTILFTAVVALAAIASLLQIQLTAQDKPEATIETVKAQMEQLTAKLGDLGTVAEQSKEESKQLEERVKNHLERLKEKAADQNTLPADIQRRIALLQADEEEKQLQALDGADKLGDEGLILCGFAAKEIGRDSVREKALAIAAAKGEEGLPVIVFAIEALSAENRTFLLKEFVKHKEKTATLVFARFAKDSVAANRELALLTGLSIARNQILFLAQAADGNESNAESLFAAGSTLKGDDLQLFLFAVAAKGPEDILPTLVQKAVGLKEAGYPIIAAAYQRNVAAARAEIVRQYRKSTVPVEQFVVREALKDADETLRAAAEKANSEP